ncbi:MAG: Pr6Pr family membrane protein, partial [Clostridia bacterium]|nr:Pr6Pr family membrane protein [Clostridia bacterium]
MKASKKPRLAVSVFDLIVAVLAIGSWVWMLLFSPRVVFSSVGLGSLKYYTVLSNLFTGFVFICCAAVGFSGKETLPKTLQLLKLSAVSCVLVTFTVVMIFLGPVFGFDLMFLGANLVLHLIAPLLACLSYLLFEKRGVVSLKASFFGLIPTFLYGLGYLSNILIHGVGENRANDFYYFVYWGFP